MAPNPNRYWEKLLRRPLAQLSCNRKVDLIVAFNRRAEISAKPGQPDLCNQVHTVTCKLGMKQIIPT